MSSMYNPYMFNSYPQYPQSYPQSNGLQNSNMNPYQMPQQQFQQMQAQPQVQQQQPLAQSPFIKFVDSADIVKATDIPMDGNTYYFPKPDTTEIYAKRWLQNGTTEVITYVPVKTNVAKTEEKQNDIYNEIMQKLNNIDDRFAKLEKSIAQKPQQSKAKKEESANE